MNNYERVRRQLIGLPIVLWCFGLVTLAMSYVAVRALNSPVELAPDIWLGFFSGITFVAAFVILARAFLDTVDSIEKWLKN